MAKKKIGNVSIILSAHSEHFTGGVNKASEALKSFSNPINKMQSSLKAFTAKFLAFGAGAFSVGKAFSFLSGIASEARVSVDALAKTALKLGVTTKELNGFRFAAQLTGVDIGQADMAIQDMTVKLVEATQETGEARIAIKRLGLDARKLIQMSPVAAFREIAEAMKVVTTDSEKLQIAFRLFGSGGAGLINTLNLGKNALAEYADEANRLSAALTSGVIKRIEALNDEMARTALLRQAAGANLAASEIALQWERAKQTGYSVTEHLPLVDAMIQANSDVLNRFLGAAVPGLSLALNWSKGGGGKYAPSLSQALEDVLFERYKITPSSPEFRANAAAGRQKKMEALAAERRIALAEKGRAAAKSLLRSLQTPSEKLIEKREEAFRLMQTGALSGKQFLFAMGRLRLKPGGITNQEPSMALAPNVASGSAEAAAASWRAMRYSRSAQAGQSIVKNTAKTVTVLERVGDFLGKKLDELINNIPDTISMGGP